MSDVENWLKNCVSESDDISAEVPKQALYDSFSSFMNIELEVGKDIFFAYLGNALSNVGYTNVRSVSRRRRRVTWGWN